MSKDPESPIKWGWKMIHLLLFNCNPWNSFSQYQWRQKIWKLTSINKNWWVTTLLAEIGGMPPNYKARGTGFLAHSQTLPLETPTQVTSKVTLSLPLSLLYFVDQTLQRFWWGGFIGATKSCSLATPCFLPICSLWTSSQLWESQEESTLQAHGWHQSGDRGAYQD